MNRTFDEAAMVAALPTGQLRNVLFPNDPVRHSAEVLKSLQTLFPARHGSYLAGILAKIGWNRPALIEFELGLIYEWGQQDRLILLWARSRRSAEPAGQRDHHLQHGRGRGARLRCGHLCP